MLDFDKWIKGFFDVYFFFKVFVEIMWNECVYIKFIFNNDILLVNFVVY